MDDSTMVHMRCGHNLSPVPAYEYGAEEIPGKEDTTQTTTIVGLMVRRVNVLMALLDIV